LRDTYSRTGTRETDLPQLSDALVNEGWDNCYVYGTRGDNDRVWKVEGRKLMEFCENKAFEILNRDYGSDIRVG
jgi:hypothetical protein